MLQWRFLKNGHLGTGPVTRDASVFVSTRIAP